VSWRNGSTQRAGRWPWIALATAVVLVAVAGLVVVNRSSGSKEYVCTAIGGPIFDVATPDEAFDAWWEASGPVEAAGLTQVYPPVSVEAPAREDFNRSRGSEESAGWRWEFSDGQTVSVSVARVSTAEGWQVAANRCSS
jgi:hypothetical protein